LIANASAAPITISLSKTLKTQKHEKSPNNEIPNFFAEVHQTMKN
jgi:hypothetical protein